MYKAFKLAREAGLKIVNIVHDEFNLEGTLEDALKMQEIMQSCVQLDVPMCAEIKVGRSWGELEEIEEDVKPSSHPAT